MVTASIDAFATLLTVQRYYFSADGPAPTDASRQQAEETKARESGEKAWDG